MKWYVIILLSCLCVACKKHQTLEEATDKPMQKAIEEAVEEQYKNVKDVKIYALKTVYADDSVCIKQCYVDKIDSVGKKEVLEYRYVFLIDMFQSRFERQVVFNEVLINLPCLPDDLIRKCQEEVKQRGESVYNSMIPLTKRIKYP
ncbi:MAG: hypothetical protein J6B46_07470 [Parabacteroides sp.]|nr:hypothetical protein [Parabacteroides sp.]